MRPVLRSSLVCVCVCVCVCVVLEPEIDGVPQWYEQYATLLCDYCTLSLSLSHTHTLSLSLCGETEDQELKMSNKDLLAKWLTKIYWNVLKIINSHNGMSSWFGKTGVSWEGQVQGWFKAMEHTKNSQRSRLCTNKIVMGLHSRTTIIH